MHIQDRPRRKQLEMKILRSFNDITYRNAFFFLLLEIALDMIEYHKQVMLRSQLDWQLYFDLIVELGLLVVIIDCSELPCGK